MQDSEARPMPWTRERIARVSWAVWGPGVLGLMADNDAGGMVAYLITGADRHLVLFALAMVVLLPASYLVQELALRLALATGRPFGHLLRRHRGPALAWGHTLVLYLLNGLILVTEFGGMGRALTLVGIPLPVALGLSVGLVLVSTLSRPYWAIERYLLAISAGSLAFVVGFLLMLRHGPVTFSVLWQGPPGPRTLFLLLALAGNSIAPWMLYWQENAVVAGRVRSLRTGQLDLRWGVAGQSFFALLVMATGGLLDLTQIGEAHPLQWLAAHAPPAIGTLLAVGIADAGLLAAITISLTTVWMLQNGLTDQGPTVIGAPPRRGTALVHVATVLLAAGVVLWPGFALGEVAVWAQAASAIYLPVTLFLFRSLAKDPRVMGEKVLAAKRDRWLLAIAAGFVALVVVAIAGAPG